MIKVTLQVFGERANELPIPNTHQIELQTLPSVGQYFSFEKMSVDLNPTTNKMEECCVILKGKVDSVFHRVTTDGEHQIELLVSVYKVLYQWRNQ